VLKFLTINNIVLIEKADIQFVNNLCILSGETGSGKSILLDALGIVIGYRSANKLIGQNADFASVYAEFDISSNFICKTLITEYQLQDVENPDTIKIRRIIANNGNNKVFINDISISVGLLAKIGETLVEINGQHNQQNLLSATNHLKILDEYAKNDNLLAKLKQKYQELKLIDDEIDNFQNEQDKILREKEYLEYVIKELLEANIQIGEEDSLKMQKDLLFANEKIDIFLNDLAKNLEESSSFLMQSQKIINRNNVIIEKYLNEYSNCFEEIFTCIDSNTSDIDRLLLKLQNIKQSLNFDIDKDHLEERLFLIRNLSRKYNVISDDLTQIAQDAQNKLSKIVTSQDNCQNAIQKRDVIWQEYVKLTESLSYIRKEKAISLAKKVEEELQYLKMPGAKFKIMVDYDINNYKLDGADKIKFLSAINTDFFDEIAKIASGGELSRFMLALKVCLIDTKSVPTVIFDEIDSGISGATADVVGKRLKTLSTNMQVLVVTHHPQIASKADHHIKISKIKQHNKMQTLITPLDYVESITEVARMLSGDTITDEAILVAKKLKQNI
jgi:DNA repair protein RecN (Recombination protein N)